MLGILPHHMVTTRMAKRKISWKSQVPPPRCWWKSCGHPWSTWFGYTFRTRSATIDSWRLGGDLPTWEGSGPDGTKLWTMSFFSIANVCLISMWWDCLWWKVLVTTILVDCVQYSRWLSCWKTLLDSVGKNLRKVHARATWLDHVVLILVGWFKKFALDKITMIISR